MQYKYTDPNEELYSNVINSLRSNPANQPLSNIQGSNNMFGSISSNNDMSKLASDIFGLGEQGLGTYNTIANGGGPSGLVGIGLNLFNAGKTAMNGGSWRDDVPQSFFGFNNSSDSEVMQGLKGAGTGAAMGATIGSIVPGIGTAIGAIIGGALGLGSSFLDDM